MFVDTAAGGKGKWYSYTSNSLAYVHPALSSAHRTHRKEFRDCTVAFMRVFVVNGTVQRFILGCIRCMSICIRYHI